MSWENVSTVMTTILYMVSAVLFIRGIKLLGKADTARRGNPHRRSCKKRLYMGFGSYSSRRHHRSCLG